MGEAVAGDGTALMQLADSYADRNPGGQYSGNIMEAIYAVNCLDKPSTGDVVELRRQAEESLTVAPTWGPFLVWSQATCGVVAPRTQRRARRPCPPREPTRSSSSARPATRRRPTSGRSGCATSSRTPPYHLRRRRPLGVHEVQRLCGRRGRRLPREGHRAQGRPALLTPAVAVEVTAARVPEQWGIDPWVAARVEVMPLGNPSAWGSTQRLLARPEGIRGGAGRLVYSSGVPEPARVPAALAQSARAIHS